MAALVETMYSTRVTPWHGLGEIIEEAPTSADAIIIAGIDWNVNSCPIFLENGNSIPGYFANVRDSDGSVLGVVGSRYRIVQNKDAFAFTDALLGNGVRYETAGSLREGRCVWMLAKLDGEYKICGDNVTPYMVFTNTHDGTGSVKVAMTPVRVVCQNTLNMALASAPRVWSCRHTGDINGKLDDARETLGLAKAYMEALNNDLEEVAKKSFGLIKAEKIISDLIKLDDGMSDRQKARVMEQRDELRYRYRNAPDLNGLPNGGYRMISAVSDYVAHTERKKTKNYQENFFLETIQKNDMLDRARAMILAA